VRGVIVTLLAMAATGPLLPEWIIFLLTLALAKAVVVVGIVLLLRGGLVSFGHAMYYAAGAYAVVFAMRLLGVREALLLNLIGSGLGAVLASFLGLLVARYRGLFFSMLNLAASMMVYSALLKLYWITGGTDGVQVRAASLLGVLPDLSFLRLGYFWWTLGIALLTVVVAFRVMESPAGYLLKAIADKETRIAYTGVSVERRIYVAYGLSGAFAGLGGSLSALSVGHVVPELSYWTQSGEFVFVALLGGYGHAAGALAGSVAFEFLRNYAYKASPYTWQLLLGTTLICMILFQPGGLTELFAEAVRRGERWRFWRRGS
jgi:ABC-type branched-subunit amino acid transport system permease subunit